MLVAEGFTIELSHILAVLGGASGVIALLFRLLMTSRDKEHAALVAAKDREVALILAEKERDFNELESVKKSYQEIAVEAIHSNRDLMNYYRQKEGKPPLVFVAPVISESHSPSTRKQRETADVQTLRASLAQLKLESGQIARAEPPRAVENGGVKG